MTINKSVIPEQLTPLQFWTLFFRSQISEKEPKTTKLISALPQPHRRSFLRGISEETANKLIERKVRQSNTLDLLVTCNLIFKSKCLFSTSSILHISVLFNKILFSLIRTSSARSKEPNRPVLLVAVGWENQALVSLIILLIHKIDYSGVSLSGNLRSVR